jgi:type I restriction enzyme S subunit
LTIPGLNPAFRRRNQIIAGVMNHRIAEYDFSSRNIRRIDNDSGRSAPHGNMVETVIVTVRMDTNSFPLSRQIVIDNCKKIIKKLKKRNRGLGEQLLSGKKRLKGFEGEAKNEFHVLGNYINEVTVKNKELKVKRVLSVTNSRGFINQSDQFEREVASADVSNYKIVKKGQFAYNPSRVNVGSLDLLRNFDDGILSPMYVVFETNEKKLLPDFLYYQLKTYWFKGHIPMFVQGSVRDSLSFDGLSGMKFFIPSLEEQQAITNIMDSATNELKQYEQKLETLQLQKKGLMQQLLTGKVRVKI